MLAGAGVISMAAAVATPLPSLQAGLGAADALVAKGEIAGALAAYDALLTRASNPRTRAILTLRRGEVLNLLDRGEEGRSALRTGLAALPAGDAGVGDLRVSSLQSLARSEELAFELPQALADYRAARAGATTDVDRLRALAGMVRTGMFIDPAAAVADADAALALVSKGSVADKSARAGYLTLKGRALMNAGRAADAVRMLEEANGGLGGLTPKMDLNDYVARSDMAIAALRAGDPTKARRYLAFTGATSTLDGGIKPASEMRSPACGDSADPAEPHADDVVVVQFAIGDEGDVRLVQPVFASRPGPMIRTFLDAVSSWSWQKDRVAAIKPFFRQAVRVEMRCSTGVERPDDVIMAGELKDWLAQLGVAAAADGGSAAAQMTALRAELARREAADGPQALSLAPVLLALVESKVSTAEEAGPAGERLAAIVLAARPAAPTIARAQARIVALRAGRRTTDRGGVARRWYGNALEAMEAEPDMRSDPRTAALLAWLLAGPGARDAAAARARLMRVAQDTRLGARDPLKVGANLRLASLEAAAGDLVAARAAYDRTGLDAMQCALVDAKPAMTRSGMNNAIYPVAALSWGFEGWAMTEFDIAPDGRTRNIRTVAGYPPFVFGDATASGVAKTRYTQSYRPAGGLGCGGQMISVNYLLPR